MDIQVHEELRAVDRSIDSVTEKSLNASKRIARIADETRAVGLRTTDVLLQQGEQLNGFRRATEDIQEDLNDTAENVSELECFLCGLCTRRRRYKTRVKRPRLEFAPEGEAPEGHIIRRITNDKREEIIDANLRHASKRVAELGKIAEQQSVELTRQNKLIDETKGQVVHETQQIKEHTARLEKMDTSIL